MSRGWDENRENSGGGTAGTLGQGTAVRQESRKRITAFYMEILVLAAVFTMVILVLVRVFAMSEQISVRARLLTNAVRLAENAAEAAAAAESGEELAAFLDQGGNVTLAEGELSAGYDLDMEPRREGDLRLTAAWRPQGEECMAGTLVQYIITVRWKDEEEPVYVLETAVYVESETAGESR